MTSLSVEKQETKDSISLITSLIDDIETHSKANTTSTPSQLNVDCNDKGPPMTGKFEVDSLLAVNGNKPASFCSLSPPFVHSEKVNMFPPTLITYILYLCSVNSRWCSASIMTMPHGRCWCALPISRYSPIMTPAATGSSWAPPKCTISMEWAICKKEWVNDNVIIYDHQLIQNNPASVNQKCVHFE